MALLTETNAQYYSGQQSFTTTGVASPAEVLPVTTFNTDLIGTVAGVSNTNFSITIDGVAAAAGYFLSALNEITLNEPTVVGQIVVVQLNVPSIWSNYGSYSYISLANVVNNFIVAYVGTGKLIPSVKRTDVMFHAKRGLQEFSYDTLKSVKSQELTIPPSLSVAIPQDYVNYVECSWIDNLGVKHIIYPTTLTSNPYTTPIQDADGVPTQDNLGENLEAAQSITNERWANANDRLLTGDYTPSMYNEGVYNWDWSKLAYGRRYGLEPETSQRNGWFTINEREGKFSFSSDLKNKLIILEYISDGLSVDYDMRIPKLAEEAIYMHIAYSILSGRSGVQEYVVQRFKRDRRAALRNAKIRLSNIKLNEFVQVMRGKSKWIKH